MPGAVTGNNWEKIRQGVKDAQLLNSQRRYNLSMVKARQTLEFMVQDLCDKAAITTTNNNQDLSSLIDELYSNRWISKTTCEHYHKIRILGNKAVHEGNDNAYDANQACQLLSHEVVTFSRDYMNPSGQRHDQSSARQRGTQNRPRQGTQQRSSQQGSSQQRSSQQRASQQRSSQQRPSQQRSSASQSAGAGSAARSRRRSQDGFPLTSTDLMRILIVVVAVIIVFFLVHLLRSGDSDVGETTAGITTESTPDAQEPSTEETAEATTAVPDTMAETTPAPVYKTSDHLNVRAEPSTSGRRLGVLKSGTVVNYLGDYDESWAIIDYEGTQAYVSKQYLVHD